MDLQIIEMIKDRIKEIDGKQKLSCIDAFEVAEKFNISKKEVGTICNNEGIKIYGCQLGCF